MQILLLDNYHVRNTVFFFPQEFCYFNFPLTDVDINAAKPA